MRSALALIVLAALTTPAPVAAQAMDSAEPFKVGTFELHGIPRVGLVLRDSMVVDLESANLALESNPAYARIPMPEDMIGRPPRSDTSTDTV